VEAQIDGRKLKYFFRQSEMNTLLVDCQSGLDQVVKAFKVGLYTRKIERSDMVY
jgi:hypothetical protein